VRNLEYKARIDDPESYRAKALEIGAEPQGVLSQTDTYFQVLAGRLKLRETPGRDGELIYYQRDENGIDRASDYEVFPTTDPAALRDLLAGALGVIATVSKRRTLLLLDGSRIHLDNVDGLGNFLELEVPVQEDDAPASDKINRLLAELGLTWQECIRASYLDLTRETQL
jgi:predicted adenylyl cyclase CyaB